MFLRATIIGKVCFLKGNKPLLWGEERGRWKKKKRRDKKKERGKGRKPEDARQKQYLLQELKGTAQLTSAGELIQHYCEPGLEES